MQIAVKLGRETSFVDIESDLPITSVRSLVGRACGASASSIALVHNSRMLLDSMTVGSCGIRNLDTVTAYPRLLGGGGNMSENDRAMAMKEKNDCLICRRCYARSGKAAQKCRKCCNTDLRPKKPLKTMKKK